MREILFRGKRKDYDNEWVYGLPCYNIYKELCIQPTDELPCCVILPETVGQDTGLTDKLGERIFEGDIVAGAVCWQERPKNGIAAFREGSFGLLWYRGDNEQFNAFTSMCNIEYKVIGNMHDNPELLKGGDDRWSHY